MPEPGGRRARPLTELGIALQEEGRTREGVEHLARAVDRFGRLGRAWTTGGAEVRNLVAEVR